MKTGEEAFGEEADMYEERAGSLFGDPSGERGLRSRELENFILML